jgi:hypothetical protein
MCVYGREKMKWSEMSKKVKFFGGVIGVVAAMTVGITGYSDDDESESSQVIYYEVKLVPQKDGALKATLDKGKKCENKKHEGCMLFKTETVGQITFYLPGSKPGAEPGLRNLMKYCPDANEVITKLELTATGEAETTKGLYSVPASGLPSWLKHRAFTTLDRETGIAFEASPANAGTQLFLTNLNSHKKESVDKQFWYKVTVKNCDGSQTWVTDPRGDNEGRN